MTPWCGHIYRRRLVVINYVKTFREDNLNPRKELVLFY